MIKRFQLKQLALLFLLVTGSILISSCEKDDPKPILPYDLTRGVAISNEGSFGASNASLSIYYPDGDSVINDVFNKVNNRPLGDVFQSIGFAGDNAYLVINSSNKIEVINKNTCMEVATIPSLDGPRYFIALNSQKGYVSLWGGNGKIGVIDLATNTISKQIAVGIGPEKLAIAGGKLFVANSGGWGTDNKISVINPQTDEVTATITVGDNPKDFVIDKNGKLWVLCSGNIVYGGDYSIVSQTESQLVMINTSTNTIEKTIGLGETFHPSHLEINTTKDILYYAGDFGVAGIFSVSITSPIKATSPLINEYFYGFNVDSESGNIYGLQAPSFTRAGTLKRYSSAGDILGTHTMGVGPNGAYFAD
ncbi:MAG: DUF5074 domain-containing protein [Tenuifilaceae bacterium]